MAEEKINQIKGFTMTVLFAVSVLILVLGTIDYSQENLAGKAFYRPVQVYGNIAPGLPDGTDISFKAGRVEVASSTIINNTYGVKEKIFFTMDDGNTPTIEGYSKGDIVSVYIEDIHVVDFSYFEAWATQKNINIPASVRDEITIRAEGSAIVRGCTPKWECNEWGECTQGIQTRLCVDIQRCGIDERRPAEERSCVDSAPVETPLSDIFPWDVLLVFLLVIMVVAFFFNVLKRSKHIKPKKKKTKR